MTTKLMSDELTIAYLAWRKRRRNHRILFGDPVRWIRLDWQRSIAAFEPGQIFGYERWEANKYGTQHWSIYVIQAGEVGEQLSTVMGIKPGAVLLAKREGADACKQFLKLLDGVRNQENIAQISASKWRLYGNYLSTGRSPQSILDAGQIGR